MQRSGNILNLILCDADGLVNVNKAGKIGKSDHETIAFSNSMVRIEKMEVDEPRNSEMYRGISEQKHTVKNIYRQKEKLTQKEDSKRKKQAGERHGRWAAETSGASLLSLSPTPFCTR